MEAASELAIGVQAQRHTTASVLYTPIREWQTRVLKLHAGADDQPLVADILVGILVHHLPGLAVSVDREDLIEYEAISYTWGAPNMNRPMVVNGIAVMTTESLEQAFKRFRRYDGHRYLWADQVCINQADNDEKSQQVLNMFSIFRKAKAVLVWLGNARSYTSQAIEFCQSELSDVDNEDRVHLSEIEENSNLHRGLSDLCCRPWNRRVWIQQEIFAAKTAYIYCGTHKLSLQEYQRAAIELSKLGSDDNHHEAHCKAIKRLKIASESELARLEYQRRDDEEWSCDKRNSGDLCTRIECILAQSSTLEATDPRDRVYAIMNMTDCRTWRENRHLERKSNAFLKIDYNRTLSQVFQDVTKYVINREGTIDVLFDEKGFVFGSRWTKNLPSWTIDWAVFDAHTASGENGRVPLFDYIPLRRSFKEIPSQTVEDEGFIRVPGLAIGLFRLKADSPTGLQMYIPQDIGQLFYGDSDSLLDSIKPSPNSVEEIIDLSWNAILVGQDTAGIKPGDFVAVVPQTVALIVLRRQSRDRWILVRRLDYVWKKSGLHFAISSSKDTEKRSGANGSVSF